MKKHSIYIALACFVLLLSIYAWGNRTANYSLDCWLSGNQLRQRMGGARVFRSMPDVFVIVDIEGKGRFLPRFVEKAYTGQKMLINFQAPKAASGAKITVNFYRDTSDFNALWNQIVPREVGTSVSVGNKAIKVSNEWQAKFADKQLTFSPPEFLAQAILTYPSEMDYKLYDKKTKITHGEVSLRIQ